MKHSRAPGNAQTRSQSPLSPGERRVADALGRKLAGITSDDEPGRGYVACGFVVRILRRVEVVHAPVFFGQAAVPIPAQAGSHTQIRSKLVFVLKIKSRLASAVVTVGVALKVRGGHEPVNCVGAD